MKIFLTTQGYSQEFDIKEDYDWDPLVMKLVDIFDSGRDEITLTKTEEDEDEKC